jgi:hypothetical protein
MREDAGSTPGLDFYILCEPICVSLCLFQCLNIAHQIPEAKGPETDN